MAGFGSRLARPRLASSCAAHRKATLHTISAAWLVEADIDRRIDVIEGDDEIDDIAELLEAAGPGSDDEVYSSEDAMQTLADRLLEGLERMTEVMDELLDASTIDWVSDRARREADRTGVFVVGLSDGLWGPSDDRQKQLQRRLLEQWTAWLEQVQLLFSEDTAQRQRDVQSGAAAVEQWIHREGYSHELPPSIPEAKKAFWNDVEPLASALRSLGTGGSLLVVPDTNVMLRLRPGRRRLRSSAGSFIASSRSRFAVSPFCSWRSLSYHPSLRGARVRQDQGWRVERRVEVIPLDAARVSRRTTMQGEPRIEERRI